MTGAARLARALRPLLLSAVLASTTLVLGGLLICFAHHPSYLFTHEDLAKLENPGAARVDVEGVLRDAARLHGQALTLVGLMVLMVAPIVSVLLAAVFFAHARDWRMAVVCTVVLALLLLSALLGRASG